MKAIKKLALLAAAFALGFSFISCSSDDEDDGPKVVTSWVSAPYDSYDWDENKNDIKIGTTVSKLYFYEDYTVKEAFTLTYLSGKTKSGEASGTYKGDTTAKNTTIVVTFIEGSYDDDGNLIEESPYDYNYVISKDGKTMVLEYGENPTQTFTKQ